MRTLRPLLLVLACAAAPQTAEGAILYGVTGDGARVPETMYTLSQANGASTFFMTLGNGGDGEVIAYNPNDGLMYHWSGNSNPVFESINLSTQAITNIPRSGATINEIFGATWNPSTGEFLATDLAGRFVSISTTGVATQLGSNNFLARGLAFVGSDLYALEQFDSFNGDGVTDLLQLDPTDGSVLGAVNITGTGFATNGLGFALATNPDTGELWGIIPGGGRRLVTIDPTTGVATSIGLLDDNYSTIAFQPAAVPEPASLALLALGVAALGGSRLRRRAG